MKFLTLFVIFACIFGAIAQNQTTTGSATTGAAGTTGTVPVTTTGAATVAPTISPSQPSAQVAVTGQITFGTTKPAGFENTLRTAVATTAGVAVNFVTTPTLTLRTNKRAENYNFLVNITQNVLAGSTPASVSASITTAINTALNTPTSALAQALTGAGANVSGVAAVVTIRNATAPSTTGTVTPVTTTTSGASGIFGSVAVFAAAVVAVLSM